MVVWEIHGYILTPNYNKTVTRVTMLNWKMRKFRWNCHVFKVVISLAFAEGTKASYRILNGSFTPQRDYVRQGVTFGKKKKFTPDDVFIEIRQSLSIFRLPQQWNEGAIPGDVVVQDDEKERRGMQSGSPTSTIARELRQEGPYIRSFSCFRSPTLALSCLFDVPFRFSAHVFFRLSPVIFWD